MNSLLNDLYRAVFSIGFFCAVLLQTVILWYTGFSGELYRMSVPLVCTFPFSCMWLDEYRSGMTRLLLHRTTVFWYILGKFTACVVSGGLAEWLSARIYTFFADEPLPEFSSLIFLCAALWAGVAALLSAATNSKYSAYGGAFVLCYFLVILHERYWKICQYLDSFEWLMPQSSWMFGLDGVRLMLVGLTILVGLMYACIVERRLSRG